MRRLGQALLVLCALTAAAPGAARELVVDLSKPLVAITAGFTGSDLLLFGTTDGTGDVVVVVRGPLGDQIVRRKDRVLGVWVNRDEMIFETVPDFYAIASNRPIDEFIAREVRDAYQIGVAHLELIPRGKAEEPGVVNAFRNALIRNKQRQGLYGAKTGNLIFLSDRLFRTTLHFPANVGVGTYGIDVYLLRNGQVASTHTTLLHVRKFGFEAGVFDIAHRHSLAYGLLAVLIAAMAGWLANVVFRKG